MANPYTPEMYSYASTPMIQSQLQGGNLGNPADSDYNAASTKTTQDLFRFLEEGTELVEVEGGVTENESVSIALQKAIEEKEMNYLNLVMTQ